MRSIAFLCPSMGSQYGGTESYVQTISRELLSVITDLRLVTGGSTKSFTEDYGELALLGDIKTCQFPLLSRQSLPARFLVKSRLGQKIGPADLESLSAFFSYRKIKSFTKDVQLLEAHYPLDGLIFPLLSPDIKKILHFHGAWPSPLFRKISQYILRHTDGCISCSSYARDELLKIMPSAEIEVIYNGVDVDTFSPGMSSFDPGCHYNTSSLKVGTVARLSHDKGSDLLCRIARDLDDSIELFLAGPIDAGFSKELEALADAPNIHLLGPLPHGSIVDFYRFLDCFVLPSLFEAFPLTILEAMASGCAVIASQVGGIPEMVGREDSAGLLFPAGDGAALKKHLQSFISESARFRYLQEQGRERVVRHFSLQQTAANLIRYYETLLAVDSRVSAGNRQQK